MNIKSQLGSKPSLFNASQKTLLKCENCGSINTTLMHEINNIIDGNKYRNRAARMRELELSFGAREYLIPEFTKNLAQIALPLVDVLPELTIAFWNRTTTQDATPANLCATLLNTMSPNLAKHYDGAEQNLVSDVKKILHAQHVSMLPGCHSATPNQHIDSGYLEVDAKGEVRGYYNDVWASQEYLFHNVIFDTPSGKNCAPTIRKKTKTTPRVV